MHVVEVYWVILPNYGPLSVAETRRLRVPPSGSSGIYLAAVLRGMIDYSLVRHR